MTTRRPLIGIALIVMLGTWCGLMVRCVSLSGLLTGAVLIYFGSIALECGFRYVSGRISSGSGSPLQILAAHGANLFLYLTVFLVAWFAAELRFDSPSGQSLKALMDRPREGVELVGVVCDDPVVREYGNGNRVLWRFPIRVEAIHRLIPWHRARGRVRVSVIRGPDDRPFHYGERWRFAGVLTDHARFPASRHGTRPVREWIRSRYTFRADSSEAGYLSDKQGFFLRDWCFKMRHKSAEFLARGISNRPDVVGLVQALLLGYRQELPDALRQDFRITGTFHIFAISGLHVAIIALFIIMVIQSFGISRVRWFFFVAPLLILFTLSTGMRPSTIRGCVMALLFFLGPLVMRKTDIPSALALAAILILAASPFQLFDYGFILSFTVVAGLIVLCPVFLHYFQPLIEPDPLRLQPEPESVKLLRRIARFVVCWLIFSLVAWLVSMPLIAYWFNLISPVALLANLLVIPIVTIVLLAGCFSILFGLWFPWLSEIFNFANVALVSLLISIIDFMARIPYGHVFVRSSPFWIVVIWFGTLFTWVLGRTRIWILGAAGLAVALGIGMFVTRNQVEVDIMNIGGQPVWFVNVPGSDDLLINTGSGFWGRTIVRRLRGRGVDRLKALVLTRADSRHAGGALEVMRSIPVQEIWCSSTKMRSPVFQDVIAAAREQNIAVRCLAEGDTGLLHGAMTWQVLHPTRKDKYRSAEEASLVLLFQRELASLLIMGRHSDQVESSILENAESEQAGMRVVCLPSSYPDDALECKLSLPSSGEQARDIQLSAGQGLRIHMEHNGVRLERLSAK